MSRKPLVSALDAPTGVTRRRSSRIDTFDDLRAGAEPGGVAACDAEPASAECTAEPGGAAADDAESAGVAECGAEPAGAAADDAPDAAGPDVEGAGAAPPPEDPAAGEPTR